MRIAFVSAGMTSESSGTVTVMKELSEALRIGGNEVWIYTVNAGRGYFQFPVTPPNRCISPPGIWARKACISRELPRILDREVPDIDVVHNHSLWIWACHNAAVAARKHNKPLIVSPHGTLDAWALSHSGWKKRAAAALFQDRDMRQASCLHALTQEEATYIRNYGITNPVAVVPNGISLAPFEQQTDPEPLYASHPQFRGKRLLLYLSRLHFKKGLDRLIPAWSRAQGPASDWHLVVAGFDDGFLRATEELIAEHQVGDSVTLTGPLLGPAKYQALSAADAFVLPSRSEGFSMAVLEAQAARLPVLITHACNYDLVAEYNAGYVIEGDVESLTGALQELLHQTDHDRNAMGLQGRRLVEERYTWDKIAKTMRSVYQWCIDGGTPPDVVQCCT